MEKVWEQKVDDLIGLYQGRLSQVQRQLDEALRQKLIKKAPHSERTQVLTSLSQELAQLQHSRALSGMGGKLRIDIGLPPLGELHAEEVPMVAGYLEARIVAIHNLEPILKKIGRWVLSRMEGRVLGKVATTLRLSSIRGLAQDLDKKLAHLSAEAEKADVSLLGLCHAIGRQPIHKELGGDQMALLLQDLKLSSERIARAEGLLSEAIADLSRCENEVHNGLMALAQPIPDLGIPELLTFVLEPDPLLGRLFQIDLERPTDDLAPESIPVSREGEVL